MSMSTYSSVSIAGNRMLAAVFRCYYHERVAPQ
jgi:hypothetical protein